MEATENIVQKATDQIAKTLKWYYDQKIISLFSSDSPNWQNFEL